CWNAGTARNLLEWRAHEPFDFSLRDRENSRVRWIVVFYWQHPKLNTRRSSPCPMRLCSRAASCENTNNESVSRRDVAARRAQALLQALQPRRGWWLLEPLGACRE